MTAFMSAVLQGHGAYKYRWNERKEHEAGVGKQDSKTPLTLPSNKNQSEDFSCLSQSPERAGPSYPTSSIAPADFSSSSKAFGATEDGTPFEWTNEDVSPFDETSPAAAHLIASWLSGFRCFCILSQALAWLLFSCCLSIYGTIYTFRCVTHGKDLPLHEGSMMPCATSNSKIVTRFKPHQISAHAVTTEFTSL